MKILIADDQSRRYERLVEALDEQGISRDKIEIVQSANQTLDCLEKNYFDLLVLDVLLPRWPEAEPDMQNSLDLLVEIEQSTNLHRPERIVGITADSEVIGQARTNFEEHTWTLIQYSDVDDDWIGRILNCVKYLMNPKGQGVESDERVDVAIICALAEPELEEVLKLQWNWSASRPIDDVTFVHDGGLKVNDRSISVCASAAPRMGMVSTALLSAKLISVLRPRILVMCGICAGVRDKVRIGDVLLADPSWDFQSGKRFGGQNGSVFAVSPHQLFVPHVIRSHVDELRRDHSALGEMSVEFGSDAPGTTRIVIGPVASGSAVLADGEIVNEIKNQHRELAGVEMEIYGMYAAREAASAPQPLTFALKGVCDFADPEKADQHQRYAAYASANTLRLLLEKFGDRLLRES